MFTVRGSTVCLNLLTLCFELYYVGLAVTGWTPREGVHPKDSSIRRARKFVNKQDCLSPVHCRLLCLFVPGVSRIMRRRCDSAGRPVFTGTLLSNRVLCSTALGERRTTEKGSFRARPITAVARYSTCTREDAVCFSRGCPRATTVMLVTLTRQAMQYFVGVLRICGSRSLSACSWLFITRVRERCCVAGYC